MQKTKTYGSIGFPPNIVHAALTLWMEHADCDENKYGHLLTIKRGDEEWTYDNIEQFFAGLDGDRPDDVRMDIGTHGTRFVFHSKKSKITSLAVSLKIRMHIDEVFQPLEEYAQAHPEEIVPEEKLRAPTVFIGHGRSPLWKELKEHLQDKHGYVIEAYETGARAGHSVRDILQNMLEKSSIALLVVTAEDATSHGSMRARQNVVHELGLFQGRLGFSKAVAIVEEGVEMSSNMESIQQIRFGAGNIREVFGEVVATLEDRTTDRSRR